MPVDGLIYNYSDYIPEEFKEIWKYSNDKDKAEIISNIKFYRFDTVKDIHDYWMTRKILKNKRYIRIAKLNKLMSDD